jgi:hypothetical protein
MIASLQRVARHVGTELTPDLYRAGYRELRDSGVDVIEISKLIRHFTTWRRAKEALALSETTTPRRIEARFPIQESWQDLALLGTDPRRNAPGLCRPLRALADGR